MQKDALILFDKFIDNRCSPEEAVRIIELLSNAENSVYDDLILAQLASQMGANELSDKLRTDPDLRLKSILANTVKINEINNRQSYGKINLIRISRFVAAAIVIVAVSIGLILTMKTKTPDQGQLIHNLTLKLKPGGNKAILTLANGQQVILTSAVNGRLAKQHNVSINKTAEGKVVYQLGPGYNRGTIEYNTMSTPLGGTYSLALSDGTKVILDAGSSIRYPVAFIGSDRRVEITGQAYFEVSHNKSKPFRVTSGGQTVEVLGTHFNINAYSDEGMMKTTLLEGSVKVSENGQTVLLAPGQQSVVSENSKAISVNTADVEMAVAWKNNLFSFQRADLQTVMRQFARWYNVQVVYEGSVPKVALTGEILRTANAEQILKILNNLGIHFKMEGSKIVIINN